MMMRNNFRKAALRINRRPFPPIYDVEERCSFSLQNRFGSNNRKASTVRPIHNAEQGFKVLVVGAGAIGLQTALELLRRNASVVLEAPRHPLHPSTCSMGAGGLWMPYHIQDERVCRWSKETLDELLQIATNKDNKLVEIVPLVMLLRDHRGPVVDDFLGHYKCAPGEQTNVEAIPEWAMDPRIEFQHLTVEMLSWQNIVYKLKIPPEREILEAGYRHAWFFRPPVVDPPRMLQHFLEQLASYQSAELNVDTGHHYESIDEMRDRAALLGCNAVVNCTGLGAARICGDDEVVAARGILHHYRRETCTRRKDVIESLYGDNSLDAVIMTEEIWGSETMPCYLIPRGDTIVVGGSYLEGDSEESIREHESKKLLQNAQNMGIDIERSKIIDQWTGFRPSRSSARCELDDRYSTGPGVIVFHSYGYGGSGWTVNVGAANECANILLGR